MDKMVVILAAIFSFSSWSFAANSNLDVTCHGTEFADVSASLLDSPQYGLIAILDDNYDTTQRENPAPNGTYWTICHASPNGADIRCPGNWSFHDAPTTAVFHLTAGHVVSVTFELDNLNAGKIVTLPCLTSPAGN
jgi:hypothetical protein